jgi:hypothetical protein
MKTRIFRDGKVHVMDRMCDTCIFRRGNKMHLQDGRVDEMVASATKSDSTIICHETLDGAHAACRGFFDRHATAPLQIAERLGFIEWVEA